jgi:hypothetical protein
METTETETAVSPSQEAVESIDRILEVWRQRICDLEVRINWLEAHRAKIQSLGPVAECGDCLDWEHVSHDQTMKILLAFPGTWDKKQGADEQSIDYTRRPDGEPLTLRVWQAKLGPNCRIVEEVKHFPEMVIKARSEIVRKVVCDGQEVA